jgi:1-acyl-sn-glycerol-3-phosphate acyltransferase
MLRAYLFLLLYMPLTFVLAFSAIIFSFVDPGGGMYHRHARLWARLGLWLAGARVEVTGLGKVPADVPVIFMSNHQGNFDILALLLVVPRKFAWIAKEELFRIPVFGHSMARAGYIPLDRSDGRRALKSMDAAAAKIRNGASVVIFPEGTRSLDGNLLPFKRGGFLVAARAGVPIIPVTIDGSRQINPPPRLELHPGTIKVRFGEPIVTAGGGRGKDEQLMAQVRAAIASGLET